MHAYPSCTSLNPLHPSLQVDDDGSGLVEFDEFVKCIEKNKAASQRDADDADTVDAFVAMGGNVSDASCMKLPLLCMMV